MEFTRTVSLTEVNVYVSFNLEMFENFDGTGCEVTITSIKLEDGRDELLDLLYDSEIYSKIYTEIAENADEILSDWEYSYKEDMYE
jgi:hypothetical protein